MKHIKLIFEQRAIPKQSARYTTFKNGKKISSYQTDVIKQYEKNILLEALYQTNKKDTWFEGCLEIEIKFIYKYPKSLKAKYRHYIEDGGLIRKTTQPDVTDNLNKPIVDALQTRFYKNDAIISVSKSEKYYGLKDEIIMEIKEISEFA